jgi:hypothetical protein
MHLCACAANHQGSRGEGAPLAAERTESDRCARLAPLPSAVAPPAPVRPRSQAGRGAGICFSGGLFLSGKRDD